MKLPYFSPPFSFPLLLFFLFLHSPLLSLPFLLLSIKFQKKKKKNSYSNRKETKEKGHRFIIVLEGLAY
jgi:hypothetical protein